MTRNQKIALGCGGAGCLGLIVVAIASVLIYTFWYGYRDATTRAERASRDYNFNVNLSNDNANSNSNDNSNDDSNSNDNSSATTSMSDDDKHKLYHAATVTGDAELIRRVNVKLGLLNDDYTPGDKMQDFLIDHATWGFRNTDFIQEMNTPEKARTYVNDNFPE
jgi:hypothetical protein